MKDHRCMDCMPGYLWRCKQSGRGRRSRLRTWPACFARGVPGRVMPSRRGRGSAVRFLIPTGFYGKGHRLCHRAMVLPGQPGAKAPGQRPSRPRRALRTRRDGRWPSWCGWIRSWSGRSAGAGETRCVSLSRRERARKSPAARAGAIAFARSPSCLLACRGPRPLAGAGLRCVGGFGLGESVPQPQGKRGAFPDPAGSGTSFLPDRRGFPPVRCPMNPSAAAYPRRRSAG